MAPLLYLAKDVMCKDFLLLFYIWSFSIHLDKKKYSNRVRAKIELPKKNISIVQNFAKNGQTIKQIKKRNNCQNRNDKITWKSQTYIFFKKSLQQIGIDFTIATTNLHNHWLHGHTLFTSALGPLQGVYI